MGTIALVRRWSVHGTCTADQASARELEFHTDVQIENTSKPVFDAIVDVDLRGSIIRPGVLQLRVIYIGRFGSAGQKPVIDHCAGGCFKRWGGLRLDIEHGPCFARAGSALVLRSRDRMDEVKPAWIRLVFEEVKSVVEPKRFTEL